MKFLNRSALRKISGILRFWRDLEFFLPFQLSDVFNRHAEAISIERNTDKPLPWEDPTAYALDSEREYGYDLYFAPFALEEVLRVLARLIPGVGRDELPDPRRFEGMSCFLRFAINHRGTPMSDDLSISTLPWALARYERSKDIRMHDFDLFATDIVRDLEVLGETNVAPDNENNESTRVLSKKNLLALGESLSAGHPLSFFPNDLLAVVVPHSQLKRGSQKAASVVDQVYEASDEVPSDNAESDNSELSKLNDNNSDGAPINLRRKRKVDILNSFYLRDLERIHQSLDQGGHLPAALQHYFLARPEIAERVDTLSDASREKLLGYFSASTIPKGRWLSPLHQNLGFQQQLALNRYLSSEAPLYAVNGPPGTGKTTLIRELLAHMVVQRARAIAKLSKPADALQSWSHEVQIGRNKIRYRPLKDEFVGYELVVASSNNAAAENISLELPQMRSLAAQFGKTSYLKPVAHLYQAVRLEQKTNNKKLEEAGEVWGLPTVPLGNFLNRKRFRRAAFSFSWDESEDDKYTRIDSGLTTLFEWRNRAEAGALSFQDAQRQFRQVQERYSRGGAHFNDSWLSDVHTSPVHSQQWQSSSPGASQEMNQLRSELCAAAFALQQAWLRHVPKFEVELKAISFLLGSPQSCDPIVAKHLWQMLFMIVPCISTTLASVERMCAAIPPATFGNVVLDEAGQATPQAAAGIIWRAKKVLVLGDQRQLEPVVISPPSLEAKLGQSLDAHTRFEFSPLSSSVQTLADRSEKFGTWLSEQGSAEPVWLGLPLLVHRRCSSPMFEIANSIAYGNLMFQAGENISHAHEILGPSCWFDVKGTATNRQWVPNQGKLAIEIVQQLLCAQTSPTDIFCITPFREVKAQLKDLLRREAKKLNIPREILSTLLQRIGTVHTFQGKEAQTVIFVLGCDFSTAGAADWAGEKPNLVNVAVTRAQKHLYVIGDVNLWHNRGYFSDLEKALPKRVWPG